MDGAFNASALEGATGAIARDHQGKFLVAEAAWHPFASSALAKEATTARNGVVLARDHGFQEIIIESDSQVLTKIWNDDKFDRSEVGPILANIKELSRGFTSFSFLFHSSYWKCYRPLMCSKLC